MHLANKRPFSPASLYARLAASFVLLYLWLSALLPPFLYFPWHKFPSLHFYFGSFVAAEIHSIMAYDHKQGNFIFLNITMF